MTKYHLIGIGGIGMSGLARILSDRQIAVSGSDATDGEMVKDLRNLGISVALGHDASHVPKDAHVVYSSGISPHNPELLHANANQLPVLHRSDLLQLLMKDAKALVVTGTHGKTTTSSLLATVLLQAKCDPSYALGGVLSESGVNAARGNGEYFVAEGDESDGSFLSYHPFGAIITNIGLDHMDYYKTEENLKSAFKIFGDGVSSNKHFFFCHEDKRIENCHFSGVSYGFTEGAELRGSRFRQKGWNALFDVAFEGVCYEDVEVSLVGFHNALNALAVFGMALRLGVREEVIREAFKNFKGVKRRCEWKGEKDQIEFRDDYAHHPTEIKATLKAIKNAAPHRKLVVLFQPHRYSRSKNCLDLFAHAFDDADEVLVTDIYGAGESFDASIHAKDIVNVIKAPCTYAPEGEVTLRPLSVFVTMGAGDVWKIGEAQLADLKVKKYKMGLIFGGRSDEHEISLKSARNINRGLDREIFEITYFYISKKGSWHCVDEIEALNFVQEVALTSDVLEALNQCEIVFPVFHGPNGEDGTLQGFFEMLNIPYVGSDHQSSAICMDKAVTKKMAEASGLKTAPSIDFSIYDWKLDSYDLLRKIKNEFIFPLYVKPVHLGSTLGVRKVETENELDEAIQGVFTRDDHVLIEKAINGRELEFAVLGVGDVLVFHPGEVFNVGSIYDYESKYGANAIKTSPKAALDPQIAKTGMEFAKNAYKSVRLDGFARVDCFLDENNQFILNEINPIPGFTETSLYPKMCEENGLEIKALFTELVCLALSRHRLKGRFS